jgi:trehalose 6-phosphate phosphatase
MMADYLFDSWNAVARRLGAARRVALILDFDGTLAPICEHPSLAVVPEPIREILTRIARLSRLRLWIVTGRKQSDLEARLRVPGAHILGVYGGSLPAGRAAAIGELCRKVTLMLKGLPGVWVEDKDICFAIHYREADRAAVRRARRLLQQKLPPDVECRSGKRVWEIVPAGFSEKGDTVRKLLATQPPLTLPIIAGDDGADESAFAASPSGLTVRVGWSQETEAKYYVRTPREMWEFLRRLEEAVA